MSNSYDPSLPRLPRDPESPLYWKWGRYPDPEYDFYELDGRLVCVTDHLALDRDNDGIACE